MVMITAAACIPASEPARAIVSRPALPEHSARSAAEGAGAAGKVAGAAIDDDFLALDVGRVAGGEEEHSAGDVLGFTPALERNDLRDELVHGCDLLWGASAFPERRARVAG